MRSTRWAAFLLGLLLILSGEIPAVAAGEARLLTDQKRYAIGEPVQFILQNDTPEMIVWPSISLYPTVWRIHRDGSEEQVVEPPLIMLMALGTLEPGAEKRWTWDQRDYHQWYDKAMAPIDLRKQVPAGKYRARFETTTHGTLESEPFYIGENPLRVRPEALLTTTWAALKTGRLR